ncbi:MAG: hypothetical protein LAO20_11595 [Acidobacteriia bacterium]|nr:hypothetical protein [Terriglobia bacterium]
MTQVTKSYDPPQSSTGVIFGNVVTEKLYDWGPGGPGSGPGALLRETDTVYQWQKNSSYLTAHIVDLPASTVVIDPVAANNTKSGCPINAAGGTASCIAETDPFYDEAAYLTASGITTQHVAPPAAVRGNLTTLSHWLNTANSFVSSHTNWYDTGEPYQNIDPLGHTTTLTYDSAYVGAYVTQTCSPQTGTVTHCVIGTYDFNTGLLTSFTDQNGQTSNYGYDLMSRMTSAQAPPDLANGSARATTSLSYATTSLPWSVTRTRSITSTLTDSATSVFDGLGRSNKGQHPMPGGTATVDTVYDPAGHVASVTNPYFSTSDPTYGITSMQYDALDRVTHTTKQDGSISTVSYSDNCITVTDEAGKQRRTCSDALGRLAEVDEPSTATLPAQNNHATMQTDGNFVLYSPTNTVLWSTGTAGTNAPGPIYMQDDGNLVLYLFKWQIGTYAAPSPGPFAPASCSIGTYLMAGQRLNANQCISSPHGQYILLMAGDGTFFIYDYAHNVGTWGPGTSGHPGAYAILQTDGNFVVYASNGVALWSSGTSGTNANRLNMEDDGRVIIYRSVWNSGTSTGQFNWTQLAHPSCDVGIGVGWTGVIGTGSCIVSPNGHFELLMQSDGNLVINDLAQTPAATLWSAGTGITAISPGIAMQTLYQYDALGDLLRVDQKGSAPSDSTQWRTRLFTYDSLGRLRTAQNPESGTISYAYDNDSELLMKTSPAPNQTGSATQTISYCYDELHRVTKRDYAAHTYAPPACPITTAVVSYTYDAGTNANGKLTHLVDQAGTADYFYDPLGRMTSETRVISGISKSLSYGYNLDGSLKTMTYPSGRIVTYTPDSVGRPVSTVDSNGANYVTSAAYNAASSLTSLVNGNSTSFAGITKSFLFNPRLQLCRITAYSSGSVPGSCTDAANHGNLMDRGYNYNLGAGDNGNVMGITNYRDTTRSQSFIYDALNRLTSGWSAANTGAMSWGETYSIDPWGNLMIAPMANKANGGNFQHAGDYQNHAAGLGYDAVGNMTNYTAPGQFVYDQENRLLSTAGMTYTYDANDERVLKSNTSTGAALKRYWSGAGNIVAEADGSGTLTAEYIYFGGKRVARIDLPANSVHYYLSDHLSSTSVVASSAGAIEEESDYYPFGTEVVVSSTGGNKYKFTGKERDLESGLDYFRARHYGSTLGRFISSDPLGGLLFDPQSLNKYTYVRNNALRYTDPTGMYICADSAKCDSKQDIAFEKARQNDLKSKDENVVRGASAYGDKNTDNGTTVKFGDPGKGNDGITKNDLGADPKDPNKIRAVETVTFRDGLSGAALDAAVGHEGSHVADAQDFAASITAAGGFDASKNLSKYQTELKAYVVTQSIMSSENEKRGYGNCGMRDPCALGVGVSPTQARDTINRLLANPANGYGGITPQNPGPTLYPSLTPPK